MFMSACVFGFFSRVEGKKRPRVTAADETCPFGALYKNMCVGVMGLKRHRLNH